MKVAVLTGLRKLEIGQAPPPKLQRPDSVLVRIDRVGVCGSDVHYFVHGAIGEQRICYPATIGHECAGTVMQVGKEVASLQPGDRVAIDPAIVCRQCDQCYAGRINTCRRLQFMGCPGEAPGALAEFYVLPAENCLPIPNNLTLDQAVLAEPLSIGMYAVQLGDVYPAARVAILGAGPIGLSVLLCAKATAPCQVYVTDLLEHRLGVARACGADWTGNPQHADVVEAILQQQPSGLDLVFECSGDPSCIDQGQRLLTPGGTLVLVGIPASIQVSFDIHLMRRKELTFRNVRRQKGCMAAALRMISQGEVDTGLLLSHRFPLEKVQEAFELVANYADGVIKALICLSSAE